jgi:uncharacterized protein (TIGR00369 family)
MRLPPVRKTSVRKLALPAPKAQQIRAHMADSPFLQTLGVRLTRVHSDGLTIECSVTNNLRNVFGGLHGGVTATLADAAVAFAIHRQLGAFRDMATVDLKINYFRPVMEGKLYARARLLRMGASLCVGAVDLSDNQNRAVGTALVTYILLDKTLNKALDKK